MKSTTHVIDTEPSAREESWFEIVRRQVGTLNYGVVQIVVHASRVVQIERTEKVRLADAVAPVPDQG